MGITLLALKIQKLPQKEPQCKQQLKKKIINTTNLLQTYRTQQIIKLVISVINTDSMLPISSNIVFSYVTPHQVTWTLELECLTF